MRNLKQIQHLHFVFAADVMDMVDVIVEGSEGLDEEVGFNLDEEMILQTFPFSAVVPVVMEARNRILTSEEDEHGKNIIC